MKIVNNLEELEVGDFISSAEKVRYKGDVIIYKIVGINDKVIQIEVRKKEKFVFEGNGNRGYVDNYTSDSADIIYKKIKKTKKRKLKHKLVTYCDWIIFKLNEKENKA